MTAEEMIQMAKESGLIDENGNQTFLTPFQQLEAKNKELEERNEFFEECLIELADIIYA